MDNVPYIHAFIYYKINEKNRGNFINVNLLKSIVARTINMRGGIPRFLDKYVIEEDLTKLKLIKRINYNTFKILSSPCLKKIKRVLNLYS